MTLRQNLQELYHGWTSTARIFRFSLLAFDIASIIFFIVSSLMRDAPWIYAVDIFIAFIIFLDLLARFYISGRPLSMFTKFVTWIDIVVIISLLAPLFFESLLFLRVLRALRLLRTYHVLRDLRTESPFFRHHEDAIQASINLGVFVFFMSAVVYVTQVRHNELIQNYIDALYFTVAALTTTGFGDITLKGDDGHLLSVIIMIVGVALFVRLVRAVFQPSRVEYKCPGCGLTRHEKDALHCKHCGRELAIENPGEAE